LDGQVRCASTHFPLAQALVAHEEFDPQAPPIRLILDFKLHGMFESPFIPMNPVKQLPQVLLVLLQACLLIELQLADDLQSTLFTVFNEFPIA
jgi:hypothetical protein